MVLPIYNNLLAGTIWDDINLVQVAIDGALASVAVAIAATSKGVLGSAGIGSIMEIGQYAA